MGDVFEWFSHYESKALALLNPRDHDDWVEPLLTTAMSKNLDSHGTNSKGYEYTGRNRTGDGYVRKVLNAFCWLTMIALVKRNFRVLWR